MAMQNQFFNLDKKGIKPEFSSLDADALEEFLQNWEDNALVIYRKKDCQKVLRRLGFPSNTINNELSFKKKTVKVPIAFGFTNESGYCTRFLLMALRALLLDQPIPTMETHFPNSFYYGKELREKTQAVVQDLRTFVNSLSQGMEG